MRLKALQKKSLFLVWAAPDFGSSRSRVLASLLEIDELHYVAVGRHRGALTAPLRYLAQGWRTLRLLFAKQPEVVIVQSPPSLAVLCAALYCGAAGKRYIIDAHSDALQSKKWMWPLWLHKRLVRGALAVLVTGKYFARRIEEIGGRALVLPDAVQEYAAKHYALPGGFNIAVVNTFARDEPLGEILQAARQLPAAHFYVTGRKSKLPAELAAAAPPNLIFTDFLPQEQYYGLLEACDAVMCLTTREHTLQCGACEALSLNRPVITSGSELLRECFSAGTVHVNNRAEGIRSGVLAMQAGQERYQQEIRALRSQWQADWEQQANRLIDWINGAGQGQPEMAYDVTQPSTNNGAAEN